VPARAFFLGTFVTDLAPDELLTEVRIPRAGPGDGYAFLEVARRSGDFALVGVAAHLRLGETGRVEAAGVALAGVGEGPVAAVSVEEALLAGAGPDELEEVAALVERDIDPVDDLHATRALRRRIARVLTARAIRAAWANAEGGRPA
jgi:carbon-monoxide dehydrogenase medium subunit